MLYAYGIGLCCLYTNKMKIYIITKSINWSFDNDLYIECATSKKEAQEIFKSWRKEAKSSMHESFNLDELDIIEDKTSYEIFLKGNFPEYSYSIKILEKELKTNDNEDKRDKSNY